MQSLTLHSNHESNGARFTATGESECVADYGSPEAEHRLLGSAAGLIDLSFRGRICLTGDDRIGFLHGQVTNDVKGLAPDSGCYALLVDHKAKVQSDLNIWRLENEMLCDFEPGRTGRIVERLEKFIIAEDVEVIDVAPHYGLFSIQGPLAAQVLGKSGLIGQPPEKPWTLVHATSDEFGELYFARHPRLGTDGFDVFVPSESMVAIFERLAAAVRETGGSPVGWTAWEAARIEHCIPRYGIDIDESNLAPEAGVEAMAISYNKGCYIGQEVISRIRTYGQVGKSLRGLRLPGHPDPLPQRGDLLFHNGKKAGYITQTHRTLDTGEAIAMAYVRKECHAIGTSLAVRSDDMETTAEVASLPFEPIALSPAAEPTD